MRRSPGQSLRIGVSGHAVSLLRVSRWRRGGDAITVLAEHAFAPSAVHPFDAIANALRTLLGELAPRGWPATIVLDDALARMWRVTPPPGAARLDDLEAAAGLRFQSLFGEAPAGWHITADWSAGEAFFAAAVPRDLLAVLRLVAQQFNLSIVGIEPHFVSAWNRWRGGVKRGAWFALLHDGLLTLAAIDAGAGRARPAIRAIRALPVPRGAEPAWLAHALGREALLLDLPPPELLQLCGAGAGSAWIGAAAGPGLIPCEALDALDAARRGGQAGAALSTAALLACGGSPV
nr:hypothetical protein [uncultured Duganella sp.]